MAIEPNSYVHTAPFWNGVRDGRLVLQFCDDSGQFQHPPHPVSTYTGSRRLSWRAVSGRGEVYASTMLHVAGEQPVCVATVRLAEGVHMVAKVLGNRPVPIGTPVLLAWDRLDDGQSYPAFQAETESCPARF